MSIADRPAESAIFIRHFRDLKDLPSTTLREILTAAQKMKAAQNNRLHPLHPQLPLQGKTLGLLLSKPSTRTRLSFEVGMRQLGGTVSVLPPSDLQIGRGESLADTARVLSRFLDVLVVRTGQTQTLVELEKWSTIPVINGLTPDSHPIQILADIMTYEEHRGNVRKSRWAWVGDGNNVANSLIEGAVQFGFSLAIATPPSFAPSASIIEWARSQGGDISLHTSPEAAVRDAHCVVTDTWTSMSDSQSDDRMAHLRPYQVNAELMAKADPRALFMHCLPAHKGEEVTEDVFDSNASVVFDEAENRLHAQKGLLLWALGGQEWFSKA